MSACIWEREGERGRGEWERDAVQGWCFLVVADMFYIELEWIGSRTSKLNSTDRFRERSRLKFFYRWQFWFFDENDANLKFMMKQHILYSHLSCRATFKRCTNFQLVKLVICYNNQMFLQIYNHKKFDILHLFSSKI